MTPGFAWTACARFGVVIPVFTVAPADTAENTCVSFAPVVEGLTSTDFCGRRDRTGAWMAPVAVEEVAAWTEG